VELGNAFIGKSERPSPDEVSKAFGPTAILWKEFVEWMVSKLGVADQGWKGIYVHKYGWSLTLKRRKRAIVYLGPCAGCFRVAFTLGDKAVAAAEQARLPEKILKALAEAPRYRKVPACGWW